MELSSSDKESDKLASGEEESGKEAQISDVPMRDWYLRPLGKASWKQHHSVFDFFIHGRVRHPPQIDLFAARPPAVKQWQDFQRQAEACFEGYPLPSLPVISDIIKLESDDGSGASTVCRLISSVIMLCLGGFKVTHPAFRGFICQLKYRDAIAIIPASLEEACEFVTADLEKYNSRNIKSNTQRLIERMNGQLVWAGVLYGAYITEQTCTFVHIDPENGTFMVSPSIVHDSPGLTAKQGMMYVATLAIKQPTVNMLANIGPRKPLAALDNNLSKLFQGLDSVQVISIEDLRIEQQLGVGNAVTVYSAHLHDVPVALKVAHVSGRFDHKFRSMPCPDRLVIETKTYDALKALQGTIIPKVIAYGLIENRAGDFLPFLAMDKIDGKTLDDALEAMSEKEVPSAIKSVMNAYRQLHAAGYTQGSVKPVNVMLCKDGRAVIIDFGRGETRRYCGEERDQVDTMVKESMVTKLDISYGEARQKIQQWEEEMSKEEEPGLLTTLTARNRPSNARKTGGTPYSMSHYETYRTKSLDIAIQIALATMSSQKLCWCEGEGNKVPVVVRVRGKRGLQLTATGKQIVSMIKRQFERLDAWYDTPVQGRAAVSDSLIKSPLQSKLCKRV